MFDGSGTLCEKKNNNNILKKDPATAGKGGNPPRWRCPSSEDTRQCRGLLLLSTLSSDCRHEGNRWSGFELPQDLMNAALSAVKNECERWLTLTPPQCDWAPKQSDKWTLTNASILRWSRSRQNLWVRSMKDGVEVGKKNPGDWDPLKKKKKAALSLEEGLVRDVTEWWVMPLIYYPHKCDVWYLSRSFDTEKPRSCFSLVLLLLLLKPWTFYLKDKLSGLEEVLLTADKRIKDECQTNSLKGEKKMTNLILQ